jgi:beta-N-acetylhexosaminidase
LVVAAACARGPAPDYGIAPEPEALPDSGAVPLTGDLDVRPVVRPLELRDHDGPPPLHTLTLRERVAQLVFARLGGEYAPADAEEFLRARALVREERIGGFVIFGAASPYDVATKLNALQRASRLPLLIASDLESGLAWRVRGGTPFPGNMAIGATGREDDAYEVGRVAAIEGRALGIHLVLAPVVDVNNNPLNPIINIRSFGEDPHRVGRLARAFIRGLREHGMLATAKHFPGHGDTHVNSHLGLPVLTVDRARLDSVELVPFRHAVEAGVDAVMSAHVTLPVVTGDPRLPATLAPAMLDSLLRRELGFSGLVMPDALDMRAITDRYVSGRAAVEALRAGADLVLLPIDVPAAIDAVVLAVERGELSEARIDSSVARLFAAKERAELFRRRLVDLAGVARTVGRADHVRVAEGITRRSLVLARDDRGIVPLAPNRQRVLVIAYGDDANTTIGATLARGLRAGGRTVTLRRLWPASGPASYDSVSTAARAADAVVLIAAPRPLDFQLGIFVSDSLAALASRLSDHVPLVVVSFGSPYLIRQMPAISAYLVAWRQNELTELAVADALLGQAAISGRLPVALPPLQVGAGLTRPVR